MSEEGGATLSAETSEPSIPADNVPVLTEGDKPLSKSQLKKLAKGKGVSHYCLSSCMWLEVIFVGTQFAWI